MLRKLKVFNTVKEDENEEEECKEEEQHKRGHRGTKKSMIQSKKKREVPES